MRAKTQYNDLIGTVAADQKFFSGDCYFNDQTERAQSRFHWTDFFRIKELEKN